MAKADAKKKAAAQAKALSRELPSLTEPTEKETKEGKSDCADCACVIS